jgi:hypothetical protein
MSTEHTGGPAAKAGPDYTHLPESPPPDQWKASQEVLPLDPGPARFAYNEDADMILRFGAAG